MRKRAFVIFMFVVMLCTMLSVSAFAADTVTVAGTVVFDDNLNNAGKRPESLTVTLKDAKSSATVDSALTNADGGWAFSFVAPKYESDGVTEVNYTVVADAVSYYTASAGTGYDINLKYKTATPDAPQPISFINVTVPSACLSADTGMTHDGFNTAIRADSGFVVTSTGTRLFTGKLDDRSLVFYNGTGFTPADTVGTENLDKTKDYYICLLISEFPDGSYYFDSNSYKSIRFTVNGAVMPDTVIDGKDEFEKEKYICAYIPLTVTLKPSLVSSAEVSGLTAPEAEMTPAYSVSVPSGAGYHLLTESEYTKAGIDSALAPKLENGMYWKDDASAALAKTDSFDAAKKYAAVLILVPDDGFYFDASTTVTVNGSACSANFDSAKNTLTVTTPEFAPTAHNHSGTEHKGFPETCTVNGEQDYYECVCGKYFEDAACTIAISNISAWKVIPAPGHTEVVDPAKAPTCTEKGLSEGKHCSVCNEVIVPQTDIPALGHTDTEDDGVCDLCDQVYDYRIIDGDKQVIYKGKESYIVIRCNGKFDALEKLLIDDKMIAPKHYEVTEGSTIATFRKSFVKSLVPGDHKITFVYPDGSATSSLKVIERVNPKTGDGSAPVLYVSAMLVSLAGIAVILAKKRRLNAE